MGRTGAKPEKGGVPCEKLKEASSEKDVSCSSSTDRAPGTVKFSTVTVLLAGLDSRSSTWDAPLGRLRVTISCAARAKQSALALILTD